MKKKQLKYVWNSQAKRENTISKLKLLFFEIDNLLTEENKEEIKDIIGTDNFTDLLKKIILWRL